MKNKTHRTLPAAFAALCALFAALSAALPAQDMTLTASASANQVGVGERFQVSFSSNVQLFRFKAPAFEGFAVFSGPNQSTSVRIVGGAMAQTVQYSYVLQAKSEGKFTIQPASAEAGGRTLQSNPLAIQVVKSTPQSQRQSQQASDEAEAEAALAKQAQQQVFLKVSANKTSVLRGEQLVATYKLYTRISLTNYVPKKMPALTGFWSQDVENGQQLKFADEALNGHLYRVAIVKKSILFPQQSGALELDPVEAEIMARVPVQRHNSPFGNVFGRDPFGNNPFAQYQDVKLLIKSQPFKITVRPLPQNNVPAEFTGGVGAGFALDASLSSPKTKTNEPVKLKVKLSGKGNLKLIEPLKINFPPDLESYDPTVTDNVTVTETGASGSRTFEYLVIPRFAGEFKIAPIVVAYYDLEKKRYATVSSPEFALSVEKGRDDRATVVSSKGVNKETVTALGSDIRYIKPGASLARRGGGLFGSWGFIAGLLLPVAAFVFFVAYRKKTEELRSNIALMRQRGASRVVKGRLREARRHLQTKEREKFHEEIAKALWGYMSDTLNIPFAALNRDVVVATLAERGASAASNAQFVAALDACEFARFAPSKDAGAMEHLYDEAAGLIAQLERELKS